MLKNSSVQASMTMNAILQKRKGDASYDLADLDYSDKFREEGNLKFNEEKYFAAIAHYNKALVCGRKDKVRSSLCYANRSAVYLELRYFKHCLHNIEMAEENYPREKIQKLHERRQKCLKMMESSDDKSMEAFEHTFKLSYEPNPKLPFFIDSLELKEDSKFGKYLVSTRDLKAGDVIAVMNDTWRDPINSLTENYVQGCYICHNTNNGDLIPGTNDCKAFFCSEACKSKHDHQNSNHEEFNELENIYPNQDMLLAVKFFQPIHNVFGSVDEMKKFVDEHRDKQYTVFDFDWSDPNDPMCFKNMLLVILNARKPRNDGKTGISLCKMRWFQKTDSLLARILNGNEKNKEFFEEIMHAIEYRKKYPLGAGDDRSTVALFFHPSIYLLSASCETNVFIHSNRKNLVWIARKPIAAGTPMTHGLSRQAENSWCFQCSSGGEALVSCKKDWSNTESAILDHHYNHNFKTNSLNHFMHNNDPKILMSWLQCLKYCYDFINENFHRFDEDPTMQLEIKTTIREMEIILLHIENPFPPSNPYLNMDKFCNSAAWKKYCKHLEIDFENWV